MSQAELFPADPPAQGIDHGGYMPARQVSWRGHEIPESYLFDHGGKVIRVATDIELLDMIVDAVKQEPVSGRQLQDITGRSPFLISKHLDLLRELELVTGWANQEIRQAEPEGEDSER